MTGKLCNSSLWIWSWCYSQLRFKSVLLLVFALSGTSIRALGGLGVCAIGKEVSLVSISAHATLLADWEATLSLCQSLHLHMVLTQPLTGRHPSQSTALCEKNKDNINSFALLIATYCSHSVSKEHWKWTNLSHWWHRRPQRVSHCLLQEIKDMGRTVGVLQGHFRSWESTFLEGRVQQGTQGIVFWSRG